MFLSLLVEKTFLTKFQDNYAPQKIKQEKKKD